MKNKALEAFNRILKSATGYKFCHSKKDKEIVIQALTPIPKEELCEDIINDLRIHFREKALLIEYSKVGKRFSLWNQGNWHLEIEVGTTGRLYGVNDLPLDLVYKITKFFKLEVKHNE